MGSTPVITKHPLEEVGGGDKYRKVLAISGKRVETLCPFKESWTNPSPKIFPSNPLSPKNVFFLPTLPFSIKKIEGGRWVERRECNIKVLIFS